MELSKLPEGYIVEPLDTQKHERNNFSCGKEKLDAFLKTQAAQGQERLTSVTHVISRKSDAPNSKAVIAGYVTLANAELPLRDAPANLKKITRHVALPAMLIARMAVETSHQGKRLGEYLLGYALKSALDASKVSGCCVLLVDAKDEEAKAFYAKYGFIVLEDHPMRLYLTVSQIEKLGS